MAISSGNTITYTDLTNACLSAMKNVCCNIDTFASNVPTKLKSGQGQVTVKTMTTSVSAGGVAQTYYWYANGSNLISVVSSSVVNSEWSTFLSEAGINARSNKVCQAKEVGIIIGLFQQFLAHHVKRVYSRRQVYNTVESQSVFQGSRYLPDSWVGKCTQKYDPNKVPAIEPSNIPDVTNNEITDMINQAIYWPSNNWGMLDNTNNPVVTKCTLS